MPLPPIDRGQPFDLSYMLSLVNQVNSLEDTLATKTASLSKIQYPNEPATTSVGTSDLVIYALSNRITANFATPEPPTTRFNFTFRLAPIVTTSIISIGAQVPVYGVVTNLTNTGCEVKLFATGAITGTPTLDISLIAIGQR